MQIDPKDAENLYKAAIRMDERYHSWCVGCCLSCKDCSWHLLTKTARKIKKEREKSRDGGKGDT